MTERRASLRHARARADGEAVRAQEAFEEMVAQHIWPPLKARGFKRTKGNFHRPVGDNWELVNLQRSYYSDREEVRFTVNLAVGIARLRDGLLTWADGKRPPEYHCHFRERLGMLLNGRDTWWSVTPDTNVVELADSVVLAIETYGLPWLEARSTDEGLRKLAGSDLSFLFDHHLVLLGRLMEELGEDDTRAVIDRELERRAASRAARGQS
jgi:hypothetical protein